jgi:hypothetical protein
MVVVDSGRVFAERVCPGSASQSVRITRRSRGKYRRQATHVRLICHLEANISQPVSGSRNMVIRARREDCEAEGS